MSIMLHTFNANDTQIYTLCHDNINKNQFFSKTRLINIYLSLLIIIIGLFANLLGFLVFSQKKYRTNPISIYLLCLCVSDGIFLCVHFFEDSIKTMIHHLRHNFEYLDILCQAYFKQTEPQYLIKHNIIYFLNISDNYNFFCKFLNFLRYLSNSKFTYYLFKLIFNFLKLLSSSCLSIHNRGSNNTALYSS